MRKNGGVLERFLKSLLVAIFAAVVAFAPAHADDACKNLFDPNDYKGQAMSRDSNNVWRNTSIDTRDVFMAQIQVTGNGTSTALGGSFTIQNAGHYSIGFTMPANKDSFIIKHNGARLDLRIYTSTAVPEAGTYTVSFDVLSADPTTVGGVQIQNIQLERGSTATSYVPYNPLCATCDGTVVSYETVAAADVPAGVQNGTPSPTNPIEPVFYKQGDMVLRRIGNYADSYDATTGKITRRIGVKVLDGTEKWGRDKYATSHYRYVISVSDYLRPSSETRFYLLSNFYKANYAGTSYSDSYNYGFCGYGNSLTWYFYNRDFDNEQSTLEDWKAWLAEQYANGTPVTVYYPLAEPVEEDWPSSYCQLPIKIATTKYSNAQFTPVVNALNTAVDTIKDVVANTITQTAAIAQIASDKQTRPDSACPAGKKCLLIEDANGDPHWYEIIEEYVPPE